MSAATGLEAAGVATTDARYGSMVYFRDDDPIGASLRDYGEWAQLELEFLSGFIEAGDTVIDAGANVGTHSLAFAQAVGDRGRVLAFEPQHAVFDLLRRNVAANGRDNVMLYRLALGSEASVRYVPDVDYASHVNVGAIAMLTESAPRSHAVDVLPVDALSLAEVRLIKIDVEGMEAEVLRGAAETLRRCRPLLFVECNSAAAGVEIVAALGKVGYVHFLKRTGAFNPDNARGNARNRFGTSTESGIFCVPAELAADLAPRCGESNGLYEIAGPDDVAFQFSRPAPRAKTTRFDDHGDDRKTWLESEVKRLEYRLAKHVHELGEAEQHGADALARLDAAGAHAAALEAQLAAERNRSAELDARCWELEARRAELDARCWELEARRAELDGRCWEFDARNAELGARCWELDARCCELDAELHARTAELAESLDRSSGEIRARAELIDSLAGSRSWQLTKPLRQLRQRFFPHARDGA